MVELFANSEDPDQTLRSAGLNWVCTLSITLLGLQTTIGLSAEKLLEERQTV